MVGRLENRARYRPAWLIERSRTRVEHDAVDHQPLGMAICSRLVAAPHKSQA